ncbi:helix-turn-helix domain-containing protein [Streptomyces sp. CB03911]|uniref:ATP-binding protein n=1 Tax=Streptomyces sp. CB03911 TaxID=1804758 RepID=UPI00093C1C62|nr:helix-turn-helix domain-containing protein [Streptomyces sp. CB03911]OKI29264.1 regulator [Streptomyces sp. CB03911]
MGTDEGTFGQLLREARRRGQFTLEALALASGVSVRAISDMERGKSLPRPATLNELMDVLELEGPARRLLVQASIRRTPQVPRQLPPDLAAFRGRESELAGVLGDAEGASGPAGHVVISAIGGMAGVGKTALAVHWAHRVAERFPDGQMYVNLRGFEAARSPLDPGEALGGFLRALGVASNEMPAGTEERTAMFRARTRDRRMIVLLDNARTAEQVRPLLPDSPGCLTIITSRNQLAGLAATDGAALVGLDVWTEAEAVAALSARIGEQRCRAEPGAAAELVDLCGHLPLAVAVVAAQLSAAPMMALSTAVRELRRTEPRLDALAGDDRRADVRAVLSLSYHSLAPETAYFFRCLALHPGPAVSAEAAASLAGVEMPAARRHLRELTSASLLSRDAVGRYILHDLLRAYGAELVHQEGDDHLAARSRLLDYLRQNAHAANRFLSRFLAMPITTPEPGVVQVVIDSREDALDWYGQEDPAFLAVQRSAADPALLRHRLNLTLEWAAYNEVEGRWGEEIGASGSALEAALEVDDPVTINRAGHNLVRALIETGRLQDVDSPLDLVLQHLDRLPVERRARAERDVSWVYLYLERPAEGLRHALDALTIARSLDQHDEVGRALTDAAWRLVQLGEHQEAIARCEEAIPILREAGDRRYEAGAWGTVAYAHQDLGNLEDAVTGHRRALELFEATHDRYNQAEALDNLASALVELGAKEEARENWNRAADLFTQLRVARAADMRAKADALL